jgi:hypothetical protein
MARRMGRDPEGNAGRVLAAMDFFWKGNQGFVNGILKSVNGGRK